MTAPLNQILYGPPGTGKTYHTIERAVGLLEGLSDQEMASKYPVGSRLELRKKFEAYRRDKQIGFVTFHQAFTYEDFVEGIKPRTLENEGVGDSATELTLMNPVGTIQYAVRKGIFRLICEEAATHDEGSKAARSFDTLFDDFLNHLQERLDRANESNKSDIFHTKDKQQVKLLEVNKTTGRLLFKYALLRAERSRADEKTSGKSSAAGTTGHVSKARTEQLYNLYPDIDLIKNMKDYIRSKVGGSADTLQWVVLNELLEFEKAQTPKAPKPYVLIIDEINRGNVANIFGELITLLEDDKRAGRAEALSVILPYSQDTFSIPQNLYILGTMNTADRSVEALDMALRRRFSFTEMLPQPRLLPEDVEGVNLQKMLLAINERLEQLLDHNHLLGHALLIAVTTLAELQQAYERNILPLLQEYFYGEWGKIGLVLGAPFINQINKKRTNMAYSLQPFEPYNRAELSEPPIFRFTPASGLNALDFRGIYEPV